MGWIPVVRNRGSIVLYPDCGAPCPSWRMFHLADKSSPYVEDDYAHAFHRATQACANGHCGTNSADAVSETDFWAEFTMGLAK